MPMTSLQQDAMARAKRGDWALADAMELLHRIEHDDEVVGGYRESGKLRSLAEGELGYSQCSDCNGAGTIDCDECEGTGRVDCDACEGKGEGEGEVPTNGGGHTECERCRGEQEIACKDCLGDGHDDCETCGGEGETRDLYFDELTRIVNLDGDTLWAAGSGDDSPEPGQFVDKDWATSVMAEYREQLAAAAKAETEARKASLRDAN